MIEHEPVMALDYDTLAAEYVVSRRPHPAVLSALDGACTTVGASCRVLEVGCGNGNYGRMLASLAGRTCWGIDPSREMLLRARAEARPGDPVVSRFPLSQGRAERLPFAAEAFDLVFSVDVIHHARDRQGYLQDAYRVLKPGGRACTVTDSEEVIRQRVPLSLYFPETIEVELARYPRIAWLSGWMAEAGFRKMRQETVEYPYRLRDLEPYRGKAFSSLHLISEEAFRRGIERMERDLRTGPIVCNARYTLVWGQKSAG